ncbi:MAG: hypothetical protein ACJ78T_11050, partial [Myxococcales bacterium]
GNVFCDRDHAEQLKSAFEPRTAANPAIKRVLANTVERVGLCIAQVDAQGRSTREFLREHKERASAATGLEERASPATGGARKRGALETRTRTGTRPPARAAP